MFTKYSSEYASIIALVVTPLLSDIMSNDCATEVGTLVGKYVIVGVVATFALVKRFYDGELGKKDKITVLGIRK